MKRIITLLALIAIASAAHAQTDSLVVFDTNGDNLEISIAGFDITLSEEDKTALTADIEALKEALKGSDINLIKNKQEALQAKFYEVSEKMYKAAQAAAGAQGAPDMGDMGGAPNGDGFYEADYTDVTDDE